MKIGTPKMGIPDSHFHANIGTPMPTGILCEYGHPDANIYDEYGHPAVKIGITL